VPAGGFDGAAFLGFFASLFDFFCPLAMVFSFNVWQHDFASIYPISDARFCGGDPHPGCGFPDCRHLLHAVLCYR
jgi:hypothetical protein